MVAVMVVTAVVVVVTMMGPSTNGIDRVVGVELSIETFICLLQRSHSVVVAAAAWCAWVHWTTVRGRQRVRVRTQLPDVLAHSPPTSVVVSHVLMVGRVAAWPLTPVPLSY